MLDTFFFTISNSTSCSSNAYGSSPSADGGMYSVQFFHSVLKLRTNGAQSCATRAACAAKAGEIPVRTAGIRNNTSASKRRLASGACKATRILADKRNPPTTSSDAGASREEISVRERSKRPSNHGCETKVIRILDTPAVSSTD